MNPSDEMLDDNEELRIIDPAKMTFLFELSATECHQKHTGTCSLERKRPDRTQDIGDECDYDYCPDLLRGIKRHGFLNLLPIYIIEYRCGHYAFSDGQHRVCIAKKKGLKPPAVIATEDDSCDSCKGKDLGEYTELR